MSHQWIVFRTSGSLLFSDFLASSRIRHGGSPLSASHKPPEVLFTIRSRVLYKQLTNRACSSRTGEYWPLVVVAVNLVAKTMQSAYLCVTFQKNNQKKITKKSPFLAVSTWFLIPGKIQDRRQDGDLCWWRHRPPAAPPSIKYTFSC